MVKDSFTTAADGKSYAMALAASHSRSRHAETGVLLVPATSAVQGFRNGAAWYKCPSLAVGRAVNLVVTTPQGQTLAAGASLGGRCASEFDIAL